MSITTASIAVALVFVLVWHLRNSRAHRVLLALRGAGACLLLCAVLNPPVVFNQDVGNRPKLMVVLAAGRSMRSKLDDGRSRYMHAVAWLNSHRSLMQRAVDVNFAVIGDHIRSPLAFDDLNGVTPAGADFNPRESLQDAIRSAEVDRVWLIGDGVGEAGDVLTSGLTRLGVAMDVVGVGGRPIDAGISLGVPTAPDFVFLHSTFTATVGVQVIGFAGQEAKFSLELADSSHAQGWRPVDVQRHRIIDLREDLSLKFSGHVRSIGQEHWRLTAAVGSQRRVREFTLDGVREKYRILYLAGRPSAEYSYLREFLKAGAHNELVSFVILRNPENPSPAPDRELSLIPFPAEQLFGSALPQFDLFILENFSSARFGLPAKHLEAVRSFVASGGALLVKGGENAFSAGGYRGTPLEDLLPISLTSRTPDFEEGNFRPKPTLIDHPLVALYDTPAMSKRVWENLPELDGWGHVQSVKAQSVVFAHHPNAKAEDGSPLPIVAARQFGKGRVMLLNTDSTWRWRLGASSEHETSEFYRRFWTRVMQYLTGELDVSRVRFSRLSDRVFAREPVLLTLRVFDSQFSPISTDEVSVTITHKPPSGAARELQAHRLGDGSYEIALTGLNEGMHRVAAKARFQGKDWGHDEISFQWVSRDDEPMNRDELIKMATEANGSYYDLGSASIQELLSHIKDHGAKRKIRIEMRPFTSGVVLTIIVLLLALEWRLRRRHGHA